MKLICFAATFALAVVSGTLSIHGQAASSRQIDIDDPRPIANAADKLEDLYGRIVTYEDPQWIVPLETEDVTARVRRDRATTPRVLIPRARAFQFALPYPALSSLDESSLLRQVMAASESAGNPGKFRVFESNGVLHIAPVEVTGPVQDRRQGAVLDAKIRMVAADMNGLATLENFCKELSAHTGQAVELGDVPINALVNHYSNYNSSEVVARDFLTSFLSELGPRYSWRLFFDPGDRTYALNIEQLSSEIAGPR